MNDFLTWDTLTTYTTFLSVVFMIVEFTKEIKKIKDIPTKQWSFIVAFSLLVIVQVANHTFKFIDIILYVLTAMSISLGSNGLSDLNKRKTRNNNENY